MINWDDWITPLEETDKLPILRSSDEKIMNNIRESICGIQNVSDNNPSLKYDSEVSENLKEIELALENLSVELTCIPLNFKNILKVKKEIILNDSNESFYTKTFFVDINIYVYFVIFRKNEAIYVKGYTKSTLENANHFKPLGIVLTISLIGKPVDDNIFISKFRSNIYKIIDGEEFLEKSIIPIKSITENFIINNYIYLEFVINNTIDIDCTGL